MRVNLKTAHKIAYTVNTVMLSMALGLMGFFKLIDADFLVYFSIPTLIVYTVTYLLIYFDKLEIYLWTACGYLILYMAVTTVCLGADYGFHLYCFSMITIVNVVEYMSFKLGRGNVKSLYISIGVAAFYFIFMLYVLINGPVYQREQYASVCWMFNSVTVFAYLIIYTNYIIRAVIKSETTLAETAHVDRLTRLYNRHYMIDKLAELPEDGSVGVLAMADIDNFKKINDTYGHNAGDEVLKTVSEKMKKVCKDCIVSRWGGEEFLILSRTDKKSTFEMLEQMRSEIGSEPVAFEENSINVTVTVGMSARNSGEQIDDWIQQVDKKLYTGKNSGKNRVIA